MAQLNEQFRRMQKLAGLIVENESSEHGKYYAVFNYLGEYNDGVPLYLITDTKEEMIRKLNNAYKEFTGDTYIPYSMDDMEGPVSYMGTPLKTYISDDWATVTYDKSEFEKQKESAFNNLGVRPVEYNEFSKLLNDLNTDLKAYSGEEITYEDNPDSMEIGITIYPGYRKEEIQKSIKNILKKNKLFTINKESIERDRDENGIMISFDIVKK